MTLSRSFETRPGFKRSGLWTLLLSMLFGSLSGALCVRISGFPLSENTVFQTGGGPIQLTALRVFAFPSLMAAALVLQNRRLICFLFFCKGFTVAYALCAASAVGGVTLKSFLSGLFWETLLPLPAMFLLGAGWYRDAKTRRRDFHPFLSALLPASVGLLLERLIFLYFS